RRDAAGAGQRCGLGRPARGGHGRGRRHAGLDLPGGLLRAGVLRRGHAALQGAARDHEGRRNAGRHSLRRRRMSARPSIVAALAALLSACTLAPRYEQPAAPVPASYENVDAATAAVPASEIGWKEFFPDPELQGLLVRALANNRDLRIATLNVEAARAQYRIQRADLVPSIDAEGSANNQRLPADLSRTGASELTRVYSAGFGVPAFELDLFGRVRSLR